jgi:hypothetical protein
LERRCHRYTRTGQRKQDNEKDVLAISGAYVAKHVRPVVGLYTILKLQSTVVANIHCRWFTELALGLLVLLCTMYNVNLVLFVKW